jgi:hypothetical protein
MFCTRTPEQLASSAVYEKIEKNRMLLQTCKNLMKQTKDDAGCPHIHLLSVHRMLSDILLNSALTLCGTYLLATQNFRQDGDQVAYKRALFTHHGKLYHGDIDYHCTCHTRARTRGGGGYTLQTSTFLDRCSTAVSRAYNIHSYVEVPTQGNQEPNISPLADLIDRMVGTISVLYTPLIIPPDIVDSTKPAANCRVCSRDAVIRGTMTLSGQEDVCSCATSVYKGTNSDGGTHTPLVKARRILFDTTQRSMCMQMPLCDCTLHREAFVSTVTRLTRALTGETQ